ncbi:MAG: DUF1232 domain-containing protein [Chloroflexi bacterium]|nr:DUF1232 domain-containing protein [Chloroflexota bacterium]
MDKKENKSIMNLETIAEKRHDPGFFREVWQQIRLVYALLRDPEVPFYLKLLPFTAVLYLLFPLDLIPDVAPVLGQLDDLTVLLVGAKVFIDLAPPHVVARHMDQIREADGFFVDDAVDEKIIIDPQPNLTDNEKDQANS